LEGRPPVEQPNAVWVADITYLPTEEGWAYLAAVMDLGTRQIRGWALKDTLRTELVAEAFSQAVHRHRPAPGLIHHSDQGCQYASDAYRQLLDRHGALSSMGRTGNCYDNAAMESFWATLKTELLRGRPFASRQQARLALFDYVEIFYNRHRLHSALGYRSPAVFEADWLQQNFRPQGVY
jgi:transposase InsO family protein